MNSVVTRTLHRVLQNIVHYIVVAYFLTIILMFSFHLFIDMRFKPSGFELILQAGVLVQYSAGKEYSASLCDRWGIWHLLIFSNNPDLQSQLQLRNMQNVNSLLSKGLNIFQLTAITWINKILFTMIKNKRWSLFLSP